MSVAGLGRHCSRAVVSVVERMPFCCYWKEGMREVELNV